MRYPNSTTAEEASQLLLALASPRSEPRPSHPIASRKPPPLLHMSTAAGLVVGRGGYNLGKTLTPITPNRAHMGSFRAWRANRF
jgi:hypothetical protein